MFLFNYLILIIYMYKPKYTYLPLRPTVKIHILTTNLEITKNNAQEKSIIEMYNTGVRKHNKVQNHKRGDWKDTNNSKY